MTEPHDIHITVSQHLFSTAVYNIEIGPLQVLGKFVKKGIFSTLEVTNIFLKITSTHSVFLQIEHVPEPKFPKLCVRWLFCFIFLRCHQFSIFDFQNYSLRIHLGAGYETAVFWSHFQAISAVGRQICK